MVARWTTGHYHLSSNLCICISEGYSILNFAPLSSMVARPDLAYYVHNSGRKTSLINQSIIQIITTATTTITNEKKKNEPEHLGSII